MLKTEFTKAANILKPIERSVWVPLAENYLQIVDYYIIFKFQLIIVIKN